MTSHLVSAITEPHPLTLFTFCLSAITLSIYFGFKDTNNKRLVRKKIFYQPSQNPAEGCANAACRVDGRPADGGRNRHGAGERSDELARAQGQNFLRDVDSFSGCYNRLGSYTNTLIEIQVMLM